MPLPPPLLLQVGFLKILHRYEITFTLPPVRRLSKDIREAPVHSLHLKLLSVTPVSEGRSPPGYTHAAGRAMLEAFPRSLRGPAGSRSENVCFFALSLARVIRLLSKSQGHGTSLSFQCGSMAVSAPGVHFWTENPFH